MALIAFTSALFVLGAAAVYDWRHRAVPNWLLFPLFLLGGFRVAQLAYHGSPATVATHAGLIGILAILPWALGAYGGADAKALLGFGLVLGNVWALLGVVTGAAVLTGAWYLPRLWAARDGEQDVSAPFLVPVFATALALLPLGL